MKKALLFLIFLNSIFLNAQSTKPEITIQFTDKTTLEVIDLLESRTPYRFYFIKNWLNYNKTISGDYKNASIKSVLYDLFDNTVINYYLASNYEVILTQNSVIYDELSNTFFKDETPITTNEEKANPVLYEQSQYTKNKTNVETIKIGKESKNATEKFYTLSGLVTNIITKEPIPNLVLRVLDKNINAVTDINGNYSIRLPVGVNLMELKSLGIEILKKKIIIYNDGFYNFHLEENPELLDEVIIDANKDVNIREAQTGITEIQVRDIKIIPLVLGERDIFRVATALPGISSAGEGAQGYNVRGGKTDQNLILLDNAVIYNPTHFFGIFSALNPYTTNNVEIYKGSIPAEFGGRLSSVFDIKTISGTRTELKGEGAIGPVTSNLKLEIPIIKDKSSLVLGARATYSDWLLKTLDEPSLKNSEASFYDFILKYDHQLTTKDHIETTAYYSNDKYSVSSDSLYNYSNLVMSLTWNHNFNEKNNGSLSLANTHYNFNIGYDGIANKDFDLGYKIQETELKLKMNYILNEKQTFNYGISSKLYNNSPGNIEPKGNESLIDPINIAKERALESAIFIADNFNLTENLSFNVGLRYSFYAFLGETSQKVYANGLPKNDGTIIDTLFYRKNEVAKIYGRPELRASVRYSFNSNFSVKASFNSSAQYIHTLSNNTTASPSDTYKLSDLNIQPERANQYSLGFYKNINGNKYELSLESYYKTSQNILDYKVGAEILLNPSIETEILQGKGKAYGIEFLVKKTKGKLNGWLSYTYSKSLIKLDSKYTEEQVSNGDFFASNYDKPHDFSVVANYKLTQRFSFSANFVYQTGRPITYPIDSFVYQGIEYANYSNRNEFRIPDYYRLDLGVNIEGNHKIKKLAHSFWNISVYNVLGRNNPYSVFFVTVNEEVKAYQSSIFSVPIPTITYNFKF